MHVFHINRWINFLASCIFTLSWFCHGEYGSVMVCLIPYSLQIPLYLPYWSSLAPSLWKEAGIPISWISSCRVLLASDFFFIGNMRKYFASLMYSCAIMSLRRKYLYITIHGLIPIDCILDKTVLWHSSIRLGVWHYALLFGLSPGGCIVLHGG